MTLFEIRSVFICFIIIRGKVRDKVGQLEINLHECQDKIKHLENSLEEKEILINDYEHRLTVNERKHALELQAQYAKQRDLRTELQQRSALVTQLTTQLHRDKQNPPNRIRFGQIILPNRPSKLKSNDEEQQQQQLPSLHRLSHRSSSLSNRIATDQELAKVLFIGRRPPTPPQQLQSLSTKTSNSTDEQFCTKRQCQLINSTITNVDLMKMTSVHSSNKLSSVLPPIINRKMPIRALNTTKTTIPQEGEV